MYLFNQPWCGACNALKTDFQENEENMLEISKNFILVNVGGDDNNNFSVSSIPATPMKQQKSLCEAKRHCSAHVELGRGPCASYGLVAAT